MTAALPSHLVPIGTTEWAVWRRSLLRAAGFSIDLITTLADQALADAADREDPGDSPSASYQQVYGSAYHRLSNALATAARRPDVREAVAWQTPHLLGTCFDQVADDPPFEGLAPPKRHRQRLLAVARYLQRYALKNDTIGFFGPVGWAHWTLAAETLSVNSSSNDLVDRRSLHFEVWAIDALARTMSRDALIVPWLRPQRAPQLLFSDDGAVTDPLGRVRRLDKFEAQLVTLIDGDRTLSEIAERLAEVNARLCSTDGPGTVGVADVHRTLLALQERELVVVDMGVSVSARPETELRRQLLRIPDGRARTYACAMLDELETARAEVASAVGRADDLVVALATLERAFSRLTAMAPTRRAGEMYAGRTLVYEDSMRATSVTVGTHLADALAAPLDLVLQSVRWLITEAAGLYRRRLAEIFERIANQGGQQSVPLGRLFSSAAPDLAFSFHDPPAILAPLVNELQRRWQQLLPAPSGDGHIRVEAASIRDAVGRAFPATVPQWSAAVQHSPDIMIAASDPDAISRGDYLLVLGEVHVGVNGMQPWPVVEHSPGPGWLQAAEEADHGRRRIVAIPSKRSPGVNSRTYPSALLSPCFTYWTLHPDPAVGTPEVIPAAALHVVRDENGLTVRSAQDGREFDLLEIIGEALSSSLINSFRLFPRGAHQPRVTIDRLVIARESWRFQSSDLRWARERDHSERFRQARAWRRRNMLPERCFYRVPTEDKPLFVDFRSIAFVDILGHTVRRCADRGGHVILTEMLPDLEQAWLHDSVGRRYTSELRMVVFDGRAGRPE